MMLLDVRGVLDRETHIHQTDPKREVLKERDDQGTRYAILSHRWGVDSEVTYKEMTWLMKMEEEEREEVRQRDGYRKIIKSCERASKDNYEWLWIDTCCIDKRSSSELSEAINSMYQWYQNAQVCYAYLNDVNESVFPTQQDDSKFTESNGWPEWFVRGWTLQELIAPRQLEFFNKDWTPIGKKQYLAPVLQHITGIPCEVLTGGLAAKRLSVAQIMSWAARRKTTRVEDRAYSLMGLFDVSMPMLYGEGRKAFQRLQLEIIRVSNDHSIFDWNPRLPCIGSVLAEDPSDFWMCGYVRRVEPDEFVDRLMEYIKENQLGNPWYIQQVSTNPIHWCRVAWLRWRSRAVNQRLGMTFTLSNAGIQVCLPVIPLPDPPLHFRAILACSNGGFSLQTIDLVFSGSRFHRTSGAFRISESHILKAYPELKTFYLAHHQDVNQTCREFTIDDKHASYHGFTCCGTYPREFRGDTVILSSLTDDLAVIVYANDDGSSRFAVGLGYYLGQGWVHIVYDGHSPPQEEDWRDFGRRAYYRMWGARADHAQSMPKQEHDDERRNDHFIKHTHLPRSIWAVRVVWGRWEMDNFKFMVDVEQCPGCCDGPCGWTTTSNDCSGLGTPGLMKTVRHSYSLRLDWWSTRLGECSGQRIALGDYGDYSNGTLIRTGNVFEDLHILGIDHTDSAYCAVVSRISSLERSVNHVKNRDDLVVVYNNRSKHLVLRQPKGLSLPANEHFVLLLKALSARAAGKHLVITVVQCSDFYRVDHNGERWDSGNDSASDSGNYSTAPRILTPLYIVASPQVWQRAPPFVQRREQFKSIREHFYALVNMNGQKKDRAVKFFSDMFGLQHLRNYVGEITFFERFPWMMESDLRGRISVGTANDRGLLSRIFRGSRQPSSTRDLDPRLEVALPLLRKRCQTLCAKHDEPHRYADEKQKVNREVECVSQTLSAGLLEHINTSFGNISSALENSLALPASRNQYERQHDTASMVQELEVIRAKLDATEDEDEQRALEEDVTGKILWLCWCGIRAEVDELLPKVVHYIRRGEHVRGLLEIYMAIASLTDPRDDQAYLQRIMFDAGTGMSKHQLLLDARAAEQAKWAGTTIFGDTVNTNTRGTSPSSDSPAPSTSVV